MAEQASTKVVTGKVRLSYINIWEPNDDGKYSVCVLIPKTDKATVAKIEAALEEVKKSPKSAQAWGGKFLASFKTPLRDGDTERDLEKSPEYKGHWFLNAASKNKPDAVDAQLNPILEKKELYSGVYGRVSINFYAYNFNGNRGIGAGLNNLQKLADGEPLGGGGSRATDDFEVVDDDDFLN